MDDTPNDRLEGWKAIAQYVGRSERAAQRWHVERGMPVYRVPGGKGGTVHARRSEIDTWLRSQAAAGPTAETEPANRHVPPARARVTRQTFVVAGSGALTLAMLAGVMWAAGFLRQPAQPARAALAGSQLTAWDAGGRSLWTRDISPLTRPEPQMDGLVDRQAALPWLKVPLLDVTGDRVPEIVVVASDARSRTQPMNHELQVFTAEGRRLWRFQPDASFTFQGHRFTQPWLIMDVAPGPDGASPTLWAALTHHYWWPSVIMRFDERGKGTVQFVNSGLLYDVFLGYDESERPLLFASGINNEYAAAAMAVLRPDGPPAASPQTPGGIYACDDCPTGAPIRYFVFSRSEVGSFDESIPYNRVWEVRQLDSATFVQTIEHASRSAHLTWCLSKELQLESVRMTDGYLDAHRRLEREGRIDHTVEDCPERRNGLPARVWDPTTGWADTRAAVTQW